MTQSRNPVEGEFDNSLFTLVLDESISGMEIDITRDELRQLVRASQIIGVSPGDFLREATLEKAHAVLESEQSRNAQTPAAGR